MTHPSCPRCAKELSPVAELYKTDFRYGEYNPLRLFTEVVLGALIPSDLYFCMHCPAPLNVRGYVWCEPCETLVESWYWTRRNALGHYFGLFCPRCHHELPVTVGTLSRLWFKAWNRLFGWLSTIIRPHWKILEIKRLQKMKAPSAPTQLGWIAIALLGYTIPGWLLSAILIHFAGSKSFEWTTDLLFTFPVWLLVGLFLGHRTHSALSAPVQSKRDE